MKFKKESNLFPLDILIFDMDGVLIDVSNSYHKTIQKTIHIYLETCLGFEKSRNGLISGKEISLFKSAGGFNNDWDLTSGLLFYLLSISGIPCSSTNKKFSTIQEVVLYLKKKSSRFTQKKQILFKRKHLISFLNRVKFLGGGLQGVRRAMEGSWNGWVYRTGNLDENNLVKRIFQEIYLGEKFTSYYRLYPLFYKGRGFYLREKLLIEKEILSTLRKKLRMGIASGRPRFEANLALKNFHLLPYFDSVITLDECEAEETRILRSTGKKVKLSKPHPYSVQRTIQEIGTPKPRCGYIGDVVDDMRAARAAKKKWSVLAIGFLSGGSKKRSARESLLKAGADFIIDNPKQLLQFVA